MTNTTTSPLKRTRKQKFMRLIEGGGILILVAASIWSFIPDSDNAPAVPVDSPSDVQELQAVYPNSQASIDTNENLPDIPVPDTDRNRPVIEPTAVNLRVAESCAMKSRIPGGGYCIDWYWACLQDTFGESNVAKLSIPQDSDYYNQMCLLWGKTPGDLAARPRG